MVKVTFDDMVAEGGAEEVAQFILALEEGTLKAHGVIAHKREICKGMHVTTEDGERMYVVSVNSAGTASLAKSGDGLKVSRYANVDDLRY